MLKEVLKKEYFHCRLEFLAFLFQEFSELKMESDNKTELTQELRLAREQVQTTVSIRSNIIPEYKSHHDQVVFYLSGVDITWRTSSNIYIIYLSTNPTMIK